MKRLIIIAIAVLLAACSPTPEEWNAATVQQLPGCTYHRLKPTDSANSLHVVRCPNSTTSTTYREGKTDRTVVTTEADALVDSARLKAEARAKALEKLTPAEREVLGVQ